MILTKIIDNVNSYDDDFDNVCPICGSKNFACRDIVGIGVHIVREEEIDMAYELEEDTYLNTDKTKIVPEDSPDAAWLLGRKGDRISDSDARKYGLVVTKKTPDGPTTRKQEDRR